MENRVRLSTQKEITDEINRRNGALNKINTFKYVSGHGFEH
jgi:hypothetical protein